MNRFQIGFTEDDILAISKETKDFIDSLIDYYISEASSYKQIAEAYVPEIESVTDTAFGIITGCVYSGFLQAYQNQQKTAQLEDVQEFNKILKNRAPLIKKALLEENSENPEKNDQSKKISNEN